MAQRKVSQLGQVAGVAQSQPDFPHGIGGGGAILKSLITDLDQAIHFVEVLKELDLIEIVIHDVRLLKI